MERQGALSAKVCRDVLGQLDPALMGMQKAATDEGNLVKDKIDLVIGKLTDSC